MTRLSQCPARPQTNRRAPRYARALLGLGAMVLLGACGGTVEHDDPAPDGDAAAGAAGTGGAVSTGGSGGEASGGYAGTGGPSSAGGMAETFDAGAEAETPPPDPWDGGPALVCESTETDDCSVCAYSNCCSEMIACQADTIDPGAGETRTCLDIWNCALQCDAGTFVDCLVACDEGNFNVQANDLRSCIYVDNCASPCN